MNDTGTKIRIYFVTLCTALYAATASVAISFQQIFYALALILWLVSFVMLRKSGTALPRLQWRTYYLLPLFWALWRIIHVLISERPIEELIQARELWLILMLPLLADIVAALQFSRAKTQEVRFLGLPPLFFVLLFLVGAGALVGLFNTVQFLMQGANLLFYRAEGLNNNNALTYSGTAALTLTMSVGFLFTARKWRERPRYLMPVLWIAVLLLIAAFILARSRGGFIAFLILGGFMSLLLLRKKAIFAWLALAVLALGVWFSSASLRTVFTQALPKPGHHTGTFEQRLDMWQGAWGMIKAKPLVGYGDAGFPLHYPAFRVEGAYEQAFHPSHVHNDLLNTWVLYGSVGLAIFVLFFLWPLWDYLRMPSAIREHELWPLFVAALASIWFMVFMGLSQCHFTDEEVQSLLWLCVGVFYGVRDRILADTVPHE